MAAGAVVLALLAWPAQAVAGDPDSDASTASSGAVEAPTVDESPAVDLDRLLTLPDSFGETSERRGGATADEWRARFLQARSELDLAQRTLSETQSEMEAMAGDTSNYQVSAPGTSAGETSPMSFKLRQELREQRETVERRERALRDLQIEANLANVPEEWRE